MVFGFFKKKHEVKKLELDVRDSFNSVKEDFGKVSQWIKHLDGKHDNHQTQISELKEEILSIKSDVEQIKDFISFFGGGLSKQQQTPVNKQTALRAVQTPVQTAVQTSILDHLTVMERAIVWTLLNTDSNMKLSYEDLSALLGKRKSTIRGQINAIKQKSEGLIEEQISENGKKRVFVPEEIKQIMLKNVKVRVKSNKKSLKNEDFEGKSE
jgi:hypothetical protein